MPSSINVRAVHEGAMRFTTRIREHAITTDYPIRPGDAGPTPLELLAGALASCAGGALAALLQRAQQPFETLEVAARAERRDEHPTLLTEITLEYLVSGPVDPAVVERSVAAAEERICPVWAMLRPGTKLASTLRVVTPAATRG